MRINHNLGKKPEGKGRLVLTLKKRNGSWIDIGGTRIYLLDVSGSEVSILIECNKDIIIDRYKDGVICKK